MANYQQLKAAIDQVIKANGQKEITGPVLNDTLKAIVNSLGAGYQFMGVATPSTNPGTPDQNVFYIAGQAGTYTNFNSTVLPNGLSILKWNGSWSCETVLAGDGVFDISAYKATGGTLATFADLSAALDGGNNIPSELRKGGMSVKFIQGSAQSSDNKYVQYRLTSNTFTTTASEWQKQGAEVSVLQNTNTITIGGKIEGKLVSTNTKHFDDFPNYGEFYYNGSYHFIADAQPTSPWKYKKVPVYGMQAVEVYSNANNGSDCAIGFLDNNNNPISGILGTLDGAKKYTANVPSNAAYAVFTVYAPSGTDMSTWYWLVDNGNDLEKTVVDSSRYNKDHLSERIYGDFPNYGEIYKSGDSTIVQLNQTSNVWKYKIIPSQGVDKVILHTSIQNYNNFAIAFLDSNYAFLCGVQGDSLNVKDYISNVPSGASYIFLACVDQTGFEKKDYYYELFVTNSELFSYENDKTVIHELLGKRIYGDFPDWGEVYYLNSQWTFSQLSSYSAWNYKKIPASGIKRVDAYVSVGIGVDAAIAFLDENENVISGVLGDYDGKKKYTADVPSNASYIVFANCAYPNIDENLSCYYQLYGEKSLIVQEQQNIKQLLKISLFASTLPRKGCVLFNIDENNNSYPTLQSFYDLLKQYGVPQFTILAHAATLSERIETLRKLYAENNEIAIHGRPGWSAADENLQTELSYFGAENIQVFGYANHGTTITPSEIEVVKKYFQWNVRYAYLAYDDPNYLDAIMSLSDTPNDMKRISLEIEYSGVTQEVYQARIAEVIAHAKNAIDKAISDKGILVFSMHSYNNFNNTPYTAPNEALEPILQYLQEKLNKGLCVTGTTSEIVEYYWAKRYNE
jgi:hypothetical protein